ncbi:hypothetical protein L6R50_00040 [Myxococcota bacterium]|nr:hypothetical protein [Myxococcota bacterium]
MNAASALRGLAVVLSALWLGGLLTLDAVATPVALAVSPTRAAGLAAIGGMVARFDTLAAAASLPLLGAVAGHAALAGSRRRGRWVALLASASLVALAGHGALVQGPDIERVLAMGQENWGKGHTAGLAVLLRQSYLVLVGQAAALAVVVATLALGVDRVPRPRPGEL